MDVQSKSPTKASRPLLEIKLGYPAPRNPRRFESASNAGQTPQSLYVPVFEGGATPTYDVYTHLSNIGP